MNSEQCVECGYDVDRNEIHECPPFKKRPSSNTDANETDVLAISQRQFESLTAQLQAANKRVEKLETALQAIAVCDGDGYWATRVASEALANEGGK